jgi:hypothetical protein
LAKELAVAIGVPVQEVHSAVRRLAKVGSIERTFALGRTHSIRLVRRESQPTRSGGGASRPTELGRSGRHHRGPLGPLGI